MGPQGSGTPQRRLLDFLACLRASRAESWASASQAATYEVQYDTDAGFTNPTTAAGIATTTYSIPTSLLPSTTYFWRVQSTNGCGMSEYSGVFGFQTVNQICRSPGLSIPDNNVTGVTDTITVGSGGVLADLNVSIVTTHTYVGDLVYTLRHVDTNTSDVLIDRPGTTGTGNGCSGDNINLTLDDAAASPVESQCAGSFPRTFGGIRFAALALKAQANSGGTAPTPRRMAFGAFARSRRTNNRGLSPTHGQ